MWRCEALRRVFTFCSFSSIRSFTQFFFALPYSSPYFVCLLVVVLGVELLPEQAFPNLTCLCMSIAKGVSNECIGRKKLDISQTKCTILVLGWTIERWWAHLWVEQSFIAYRLSLFFPVGRWAMLMFMFMSLLFFFLGFVCACTKFNPRHPNILARRLSQLSPTRVSATPFLLQHTQPHGQLNARTQCTARTEALPITVHETSMWTSIAWLELLMAKDI